MFNDSMSSEEVKRLIEFHRRYKESKSGTSLVDTMMSGVYVLTDDLVYGATTTGKKSDFASDKLLKQSELQRYRQFYRCLNMSKGVHE